MADVDAGMRLTPIDDERARPEPLVHPDTLPYWDGLRAGELRVQVCCSCGTYRYPFGPICFHCRSFEHTWAPIHPVGRIAAAVLVQRATGDPIWAGHVPFLSGSVDLEHDLRLPGRILCTCGAARRRGTVVRAVLLQTAGLQPVHAFAHECVAPLP